MRALGGSCLLAAGALLVMGAGGTPAGAVAVKAEVTRICHASIDTFDEEVSLRASAEGLGEDGRKEFLRRVRARSPEASCALGYLVELRDQRAIPLIRKILKDGKADVWLKQQAVGGAGVFRDAGSFDGVLAAFRSGNIDLIEPAAIALGALRDERGLRVLREALADPKLRFSVVVAVGFKGHDAAVAPLMALMNEPAVAKSSSVRFDLAHSLARIGTPKSRDAAMTLLDGLEDEMSHRRLLQDLWEIFILQRGDTQDPSDLSDINKQLARLRADPAAPNFVKERP